MRLSEQDVKAIKSAALEAFGPTTVVRLFGSRLDDNKRGGDIDLHLEVDSVAGSVQKRVTFQDRVFAKIEPQRIDLLVSRRGAVVQGFERVAYRDGRIL